MMHHAITQAIGQVRTAELHRQAQRAALARAAHHPRRAHRQPSWHHGRRIPAPVTAVRQPAAKAV